MEPGNTVQLVKYFFLSHEDLILMSRTYIFKIPDLVVCKCNPFCREAETGRPLGLALLGRLIYLLGQFWATEIHYLFKRQLVSGECYPSLSSGLHSYMYTLYIHTQTYMCTCVQLVLSHIHRERHLINWKNA